MHVTDDPLKKKAVYSLAERLFAAFITETLKNQPLKVVLERLGNESPGHNVLRSTALGALQAANVFCEMAENFESAKVPWKE